jgi:uncharacterized lipoprotein
MRKVILACIMAASLAGCSWTHRDRNTESSGSSTPPASQAQSERTSPAGTGAGLFVPGGLRYGRTWPVPRMTYL